MGVAAVTQIAQAKAKGVYPTIEEAVTRNLGKEFNSARVESITSLHCSPNDSHGHLPFVWFCTARVRMDRIPDGYDKSDWLAGNFYVRVRDGWVFMSEAAFPGFVGRVMELYGMEDVDEWIAENR